MRTTDSLSREAAIYILSQMEKQKNTRSESGKRTLSDDAVSETDCYLSGTYEIYANYNNIFGHEDKFSSSILDYINFEYTNLLEDNEQFTIGNVIYLKSDIPPVDLDRCREIKAANNHIKLECGTYYKYYDSEGTAHAMTCVHDKLKQPYSELASNKADRSVHRNCMFWNLLSKDGTYMGMYYTQAEERKLLNDAGITEGFFSVQIGSHKQEYYYSNGVAGVSVLKSRYDATYDMWMHREGFLDEWEEGAVFKIGGKDYVLGADKRLDLPYGADIYDIKYPPKSKRNS